MVLETALSQSNPTPNTSDPAFVVVNAALCAPLDAAAPAVAPTPAELLNVTTVRDCRKVRADCVSETVTFVNTLAALAFQISALPACVFVRLTSVQVADGLARRPDSRFPFRRSLFD